MSVISEALKNYLQHVLIGLVLVSKVLASIVGKFHFLGKRYGGKIYSNSPVGVRKIRVTNNEAYQEAGTFSCLSICETPDLFPKSSIHSCLSLTP